MKINITAKIFIGMTLGIILGFILNKNYATDTEFLDKIGGYLNLLSKVFLRMIKMIIGPLIFSILTVGIAKLGDFKLVGRIGIKTLGYFYFATILSLLTGLIAVNLLKPGKMMQLDLPAAGADTGVEVKKMTLENFITHVFPESFFDALAHNEVLQIVVFSIFFGIATAAIGDTGKIIIKGLHAVSEVMFKIVSFVMGFAPYGVFGAVAAVIAQKGVGILGGYLYLIVCFFATLTFFILVVLPAICFFAKVPYWKLLAKVKDALFLSFGTASSEASMPLQIEKLKEFGVSERIVSFVLPLGYSFNLDGSMMYMTFAVGFIAQAYGIELSAGQQITMMLTLLLTSKGIAGVPRASLVVIAGTMSMFNLPAQGLILLFAVDWLLDMGRSATSVAGNAVATAVVAKWEGELDFEMMNKH
jgi:Na+/H+-dicarboxylate symporter